MSSINIFLHPYIEASGDFQMKYDEKMMYLGGNGIHLRFYRFSPKVVSIGYLQKKKI